MKLWLCHDFDRLFEISEVSSVEYRVLVLSCFAEGPLIKNEGPLGDH